MSTSGWQQKINIELEHARGAQASGNEGQARVCARRAAGIAIGEYLQRQNLAAPGPGAISQITFLATLPQLSPQIQQVCYHLTLRVNEDFQLPLDVDLIDEVRWLISELLPDEIGPENRI